MDAPKGSSPWLIGGATTKQPRRNQQCQLPCNTHITALAQCFSRQEWKRIEAANLARSIADLAAPHTGLKRLTLLHMAGHYAGVALGVDASSREAIL